MDVNTEALKAKLQNRVKETAEKEEYYRRELERLQEEKNRLENWLSTVEAFERVVEEIGEVIDRTEQPAAPAQRESEEQEQGEVGSVEDLFLDSVPLTPTDAFSPPSGEDYGEESEAEPAAHREKNINEWG